MTTCRSTAATQLELPLPDHSPDGRTGGGRTGAGRTGAGRGGARRGGAHTDRRSPGASVRRTAEPSGPRRGAGNSSRLDEQTRAIGRQGIAAARALLATGAASDDPNQAGVGRGTTGCAA